jgi:predicted GNAT superfamily acetyltransferase
METAPRIVDIKDEDLAGLLALNNEHAIEVNALTADELARFVALAARARVVEGGSAFLIAFDETTPPQGPNHAWFRERLPAFVYVDRVVVAAPAQGRGLGRLLYQDLIAFAGARPLCCEVNIVPPNPTSLAFHERLDFKPYGEAVDPRSDKRVRYFIRR